MLGPPKRRQFDRQLLVSLENLVPPDNFYRYLDARLDLSFVRAWVTDCYAGGGRPSIDPVVFFKLHLMLFFEGLRSERKLMETVALNLAHRWYLGYDLDEALPEHSSLTRIRLRLGLPLFQRFFDRVVDLCQDAGLIWGKELIFDATKVRANAAIDSLRPRWFVAAKAHLDDLFAAPPGPADPAEPAPADRPQLPDAGVSGSPPVAADGPVPVRLPFPGSAAAEQHVAQSNQATWKLLEERRLDPTRPAAHGYHRTAAVKVSTTDPDAAPMRAYLGERTKLGYHDHYVVDGGKARIILAALVTPADVMENQPMQDLLWRVRFRWHLHPRRAVGDTTYGTVDNIRALEAAGIRAYLPLPDFDQRTGSYGASQFRYDAADDVYRCPQGRTLSRYTADYAEEVTLYRAEAAECNACPVKTACTASSHGRLVSRSFSAAYLERVRRYHQTAAYAKAMAKRKVWMEPLFGEAKDWHGLRRFRLRGLWKVNCEALLVAAGQNLKRWLAKVGWGRRATPSGGPASGHGQPLHVFLGFGATRAILRRSRERIFQHARLLSLVIMGRVQVSGLALPARTAIVVRQPLRRRSHD
jgi:transposase